MYSFMTEIVTGFVMLIGIAIFHYVNAYFGKPIAKSKLVIASFIVYAFTELYFLYHFDAGILQHVIRQIKSYESTEAGLNSDEESEESGLSGYDFNADIIIIEDVALIRKDELTACDVSQPFLLQPLFGAIASDTSLPKCDTSIKCFTHYLSVEYSMRDQENAVLITYYRESYEEKWVPVAVKASGDTWRMVERYSTNPEIDRIRSITKAPSRSKYLSLVAPICHTQIVHIQNTDTLPIEIVIREFHELEKAQFKIVVLDVPKMPPFQAPKNVSRLNPEYDKLESEWFERHFESNEVAHSAVFSARF